MLQTLYLGNGQACVDQCNSRPACTYALYADGICTLGRDVFFGSGVNTPDPSVTQLCLRAMGAPDTSKGSEGGSGAHAARQFCITCN